ncbi:LSU ribosomal protein L6p (L9e) [hydrothermal vent metagenome]|uniref:LSU ribosomal protein L6p (L9e) n=1 Tax=hydrothermal vent metagenome TaxID=652676 RepID=A0A3B0XN06_9ZZZZ
MSRIAKKPISIPAGIEVKISGKSVNIKGPKGNLSMELHKTVSIAQNGEILNLSAENESAMAMTGTMRSLVNNMVTGVSEGFEKKLELTGVGYRANAKGNSLNLQLGFSHPVDYAVPEGITVETPSQTEILVKGADKQKVGQVSAEIRAYRPPEPYKGKGVRYADEYVIRKEAKKK